MRETGSLRNNCCDEVRLIGLSIRSGDVIAQLLPKGGTSHRVLIAFPAGSLPATPPPPPMSSNFIQHQKDTPSSWLHLHPPPPPLKEIRASWHLMKFLTFTLSPSLDGFNHVFFSLWMRGEGLVDNQ